MKIGTDPVIRRFVWKHIDAIKKNRVVLLTTHAMKEADLLSDSVAVIVSTRFVGVSVKLSPKSKSLYICEQ
jgi:ABC-type multidrug transport system ATPase subunit